MNKSANAMNTFIDRISGFHQYVFSPSVHLRCASKSLCNMLDVTEEELVHEKMNLYVQMVHPADRTEFETFLHKLAQYPQTLTAEYRLCRSDNTTLYVHDTATSYYLPDGILAADCVLTDITDLKSENDNLQFLNETIPCGFLKYTCEKQPKVTYINQKMKEILRFHESENGESDFFSIYENDIFLLIPMEERHRFSLYLNRVYSGLRKHCLSVARDPEAKRGTRLAASISCIHPVLLRWFNRFKRFAK